MYTTCESKYLGYGRVLQIKRDEQNGNSTVIKTYKWLSYTVNHLAKVIIFTTADLRLSVRHGNLAYVSINTGLYDMLGGVNFHHN